MITTRKPTTGRVLMVRPAVFAFNPLTATSNRFQSPSDLADLPARARAEFDQLVKRLKEAGVEVVVVDDEPDPPRPDAVFPNNWISTHEEGTIVLYPLEALTRRPERRPEIVTLLRDRFGVSRLIDLTGFEAQSSHLEGTGSLVLDRLHRKAYAAQSSRTERDLVQHWGLLMGYETSCFETVPLRGSPPYHTNVLMAIGHHWAVVGSPLIRDATARGRILAQLRKDGHDTIELTPEQIENFAGNLLELDTPTGSLIVGSDRAWSAFRPEQIRRLEAYARILSVPLDRIESVGGGSARCMIAELFLPNRAPPDHPGSGKDGSEPA